MVQKLLIVLFFTLFSQTWSCKLMPDKEDTQICDSWEDFEAAGSHPEWKKLVIKNANNFKKRPLGNGLLKDVPNLENLWIENLVNKLEPEAFKNVPNLKILHLINNEIEEIPARIFDGLKLKVLQIKNSHVRKLEPGTINNTEFVNLGGNFINPKNIFQNTNITLLDLSNNSISKLEDCAFCGMKNTKFLNLHENSLTIFDPIKILGENSQIMGIGLNENKLTSIFNFGTFTNLQGITAVNNSIEKIEDNSFAKSPNFGLLEVSGNKLTDIPANIFPDFGDREDPAFLILSNNKIQCLSKELLDKVKKVRRVTVENNPWKCECLQDVIAWAKQKKAFIGCDDFNDTCDVKCTDKDKKEQIINLYV